MDIKQVTETIAMIEEQNFDVRTITMVLIQISIRRRKKSITRLYLRLRIW